MEDVLFAAAVGGYFALAFAWPTFRLWKRHGVWPIVFHREAAPAQRVFGLLSGALFLGMLLVGILHVLAGPDALGVWRPPAAMRVAGWLLLAAGTVMTVVAQRQMGASWRVGIDDRPTALVTGGLFRYVRNPIFTALLLFLAGMVTLSAAWWSVAVLALTVLGLRYQVVFEEKHLLTLHGDAYSDYAARTGRFFPFVGRLPTS